MPEACHRTLNAHAAVVPPCEVKRCHSHTQSNTKCLTVCGCYRKSKNLVHSASSALSTAELRVYCPVIAFVFMWDFCICNPCWSCLQGTGRGRMMQVLKFLQPRPLFVTTSPLSVVGSQLKSSVFVARDLCLAFVAGSSAIFSRRGVCMASVYKTL